MRPAPSRGLRSNPRAVSTSRRTRPASRWPAPLKVRRCAQGYEARPGGHRARLILGSRSGVNRCTIQHNRVFCKVAPVARRARLVSQPLRLRLRALRVRRSSVMSCAPARLPRGQRCSPRSKTKVCAVTALAVTAKVPVRRLRRVRGVEAPARPGQSAGAGSCRLRRHSLPAPSACPSRPPPRSGGSPKAKNAACHAVQAEVSSCAACASVLHPCASRPSPAGARAARP